MTYFYIAAFYAIGYGAGYKRQGMKWETVFFNGYLPGMIIGSILSGIIYIIHL